MRKQFLALLTGALVVVLTVGVGASTAGSAAPTAKEPAARGTDSLPNPLADKQEALRLKAFEMQAKGQIPQGAKVGKVAKGQYVQLTREGEDSIFTVLGQFGNQINPTYGGTAGPQRNQIEEPDRTTDNTTIWTSDFSQPYYHDLLFDDAPGAISMRNFYIEQSSGRYAVNGDVTDWVEVPFNEANYGSNYCGDIVCARTWLFVRDSVNAWYNAQVAAGKTAAQINAYLAKFDIWDRYDYDGDGNFNEPDGYIDHFQSIHAGEGEETGGGAPGHRRDLVAPLVRLLQQLIGFDRPGLQQARRHPDRQLELLDRRLHDRAGERRRRRVLARVRPRPRAAGPVRHVRQHRRRRELDRLLDELSSGSYGNNGDPAEGIGDRPIHMSAWEKFQLGWLNYEVVGPGQKKRRSSSDRRRPTRSRRRPRRRAARQARDREPRIALTRARSSTSRVSGNNLDNHDVQVGHLAAGASAHGAGSLRHRAGLGLRLRRTSRGRRRDVDRRADQPLDEHQPERPELRQRHHR